MHLTQIQSRYGVATTSTPRPGGSPLGVAVELARAAHVNERRGFEERLPSVVVGDVAGIVRHVCSVSQRFIRLVRAGQDDAQPFC